MDKKLAKITRPSQELIKCLNEFVTGTSQKISAALNDQISTRQKIAQDVQALINTRMPGW